MLFKNKCLFSNVLFEKCAFLTSATCFDILTFNASTFVFLKSPNNLFFRPQQKKINYQVGKALKVRELTHTWRMNFVPFFSARGSVSECNLQGVILLKTPYAILTEAESNATPEEIGLHQLSNSRRCDIYDCCLRHYIICQSNIPTLLFWGVGSLWKTFRSSHDRLNPQKDLGWSYVVVVIFPWNYTLLTSYLRIIWRFIADLHGSMSLSTSLKKVVLKKLLTQRIISEQLVANSLLSGLL